MNTVARGLATLALTALGGAGLVGCSSEGGDTASGVGAVTTTVSTTTTSPMSSAPVPGPADAPVDIPAVAADRWNELGGVDGDLGRATGPATDVAGGSLVRFERGALVVTPDREAFVVQGEILAAYLEAGGPDGELGFPTADEATTDGGWISTFDSGVITFLDGAASVEVD